MTKLTISDVEKAIDLPRDAWNGECHAVSLQIIKHGLVPGGRVARGTCRPVGGQHSWIVDGRNCYAKNAKIIDPTLFAYVPKLKGIFHGSPSVHGHIPHGSGSIWEYGKPQHHGGETIKLRGKLSPMAKQFLGMIGPLDREGWASLARAPIGGWPAAEILAAIDNTPKLVGMVPIDVIGMATEANPCGLYW